MRNSTIKRQTNETNIALSFALDGNGERTINTGVGFFDHMLELFAVHGNFDLNVECVGDTHVDCHHTVEDIGITLGKAIKESLGDKFGIARYGSMILPMDECLAEVAVDISGRAYLVFNAELFGRVGSFDMEMVEEFFRAVVVSSGMTLHINLKYGKNEHHKAEGIFKAFARALAIASRVVGDKLPSSKGVIE